MGINNLLSSLKSIKSKVNINKYKNMKIGIDGYCYLYKGTFKETNNNSHNNSNNTSNNNSNYIAYFLELLSLLRNESIIPIVIFDGRLLPSKEITNKKRREIKQYNKNLAILAELEERYEEAKLLYQKSISITSEMVYEVIKELKKLNIEYIVAPYESDAQLAYLSLTGYVDVVMTEDSDSIPYGCRCVLLKLEQSGYGEEICRKSLGANTQLNFLHWNDEQFKIMCCLSGCDYAPKIRNIGIITAYKIVDEYKTLSSIIQYLRNSKYQGINDEYIQQLLKAFYTFKHQTIYNPITKLMQPLTPFDSSYDWRLGIEYLGEILDPITSERIAKGEIHPMTLEPFQKIDLQNNNDNNNNKHILQNSNESIQKEKIIDEIKIKVEKDDKEEIKYIDKIVWSSICSFPEVNKSNEDRNRDEDENQNEIVLDSFLDLSVPSQDLSSDNVDNNDNNDNNVDNNEHFKNKNKDKKDSRNKLFPKFQTNNFIPISGIETLHRRKRRHSFDPTASPTLLNSPSAFLALSSSLMNEDIKSERELLVNNKKSKSLDYLTPSIYENFDWNPIESGENSTFNSNDNNNNNVLDRNKYVNMGIIRYQPKQILSQHQNPFQLPKKI